MTKLITAIVVLLVLVGCYYDNEVDLYGENNCTELPVSYSGAVQEVVQRACYQCHSNDTRLADISVEGYENIIPYVEDGSLMGTIRHENGFSPMPQDREMLPNCEIKILQQWIDQGAPDN